VPQRETVEAVRANILRAETLKLRANLLE